MQDRFRAECGLDCYFSCYKNNARGVAILLNNTFDFKIHGFSHDDICIYRNFDFIDPWRIQNPNVRRFTRRQHATLKQSRLDFFLISSELGSNLVSCDINPGYRADHSLVDICLDFNQMERGPGYLEI